MLRILFFTANTEDSPPLNLDGEFRSLVDLLRKDGLLGVHVDEPCHVRHATFHLLEQIARKFRPHILVLAGHSADETLVIESTAGVSVKMPATALGPVLRHLVPELRCLLLNLCDLAPQAQALLPYVPYTIGMKGTIPDQSAIAFSTSFCYWVAKGDSLGSAFTNAQNRIHAIGLTGKEMPQHFFRQGADQLPLVHKVKIFCLHHQRDNQHYDELGMALAAEQNAGLVDIQSSDPPPKGAAQAPHRNEDQLDKSNLIIPLLSQEFLSDRRCDMLCQQAIRQHELGKSEIASILTAECSWHQSALGGSMVVLPKNGLVLHSRPKRPWWQRVRAELLPIIHRCEDLLLDKLWSGVEPDPPPWQPKIESLRMRLSELDVVDLLLVPGKKDRAATERLENIRSVLTEFAPGSYRDKRCSFVLSLRNGEVFLQTYPGLRLSSGQPAGGAVNLSRECTLSHNTYIYRPQADAQPGYKYRIHFVRDEDDIVLFIFGVLEKKEFKICIEGAQPKSRIDTLARVQ